MDYGKATSGAALTIFGVSIGYPWIVLGVVVFVGFAIVGVRYFFRRGA